MSDDAPTTIPYATPVPRRRNVRFWVAVAAAVVLFVIGLLLALLAYRGERAARAQTVAARAATAQALAERQAVHIAPHAPSRVTIVQRKSQALPGTNGTIIARIGDVTGGQVLLNVDDINGQQLVPTSSMREGDVQQFTVGSATFDIELVELKNFLTGDDFAVFEVRAAGTALSEEEKIKRLIDAVANEPGVTFIRNGEAHGGAEAAAHLNRKYQAAGRGLTARDFIDEVASRSSVSGQVYHVKLPDGTEQPSAQWLSARLREIESRGAIGRAPTTRAGN